MSRNDEGPQAIVVIGVSGVGKTTLGERIAKQAGWPFAEGDDFHPDANVAKMAKGEPLTDDDRWPWLQSIADWMSEHLGRGESVVVACSALRRAYRDLLREASPGHIHFLHLVAGQDTISERISHRHHRYMPASLLPSQFATLEPLEPDELASGSIVVDVSGDPDQTLSAALDALGWQP